MSYRDVSTLNRLSELSTQRRASSIPRYRDTKIQRYKDTKIQRYRDTEIQRYKDTTNGVIFRSSSKWLKKKLETNKKRYLDKDFN